MWNPKGSSEFADRPVNTGYFFLGAWTLLSRLVVSVHKALALHGAGAATATAIRADRNKR